MIRAIRRLSIAVLPVVALHVSLALSQYSPTTPDSLPNNYPAPLPSRRGPAPSLVFALAGEVALPAGLGPADAWADGEAVYVPLATGVARTAPALDARPEMVEAEPPPGSSDGWVYAADRKHRYRTTPEGVVEAQRKSWVGRRWVRSWLIVAPNSTLAPPLLIGPRLCYAGLDDRVTCVRASNGDRLWSVDLGDRLSRRIAPWSPSPAERRKPARGQHAVEGEVLLVVPDNGASVVALDAYAGTRLASYELPPARNRFRSEAFVFQGGRIAVVRKGYAEYESALTLLDLLPAGPADPLGAVPYNGEPTKAETPPGR